MGSGLLRPSRLNTVGGTVRGIMHLLLLLKMLLLLLLKILLLVPSHIMLLLEVHQELGRFDVLGICRRNSLLLHLPEFLQRRSVWWKHQESSCINDVGDQQDIRGSIP